MDPLSELVSALLSHRTRNADSAAAFKELRRRFPTWTDVMKAPVAQVEEVIARATWPEQKAPRIQQILRAIAEENRGELSLGFLAELSVSDARAWLERLPGVGPKTSAAVLCFSSLRRAALPVDCHHHRVAQRLGLIPRSMSEAASHVALASLLPTHWGPQEVFDHHEVMMFHGQRCCYYASPACARCPLSELCPEGLERLSGSTDSAKAGDPTH